MASVPGEVGLDEVVEGALTAAQEVVGETRIAGSRICMDRNHHLHNYPPPVFALVGEVVHRGACPLTVFPFLMVEGSQVGGAGEHF